MLASLLRIVVPAAAAALAFVVGCGGDSSSRVDAGSDDCEGNDRTDVVNPDTVSPDNPSDAVDGGNDAAGDYTADLQNDGDASTSDRTLDHSAERDVYVPDTADATDIARETGRDETAPDSGPDDGADALPDRTPDARRPGFVVSRGVIEGEIIGMYPTDPVGRRSQFFVLADSPAKLWACLPSLEDGVPSCRVSAEFYLPEGDYVESMVRPGMHPVTYARNGHGIGAVNFMSDTGRAATVAEIEEAPAETRRAVLGWASETEFWGIPLFRPGGMAIANVPVPAPEHRRGFMTANAGAFDCADGLVPAWSNEYGIPMLRGAAGFLEGRNATTLRITPLTLEGHERANYLVAITAGCEGLSPQIEYRDPEDAEVRQASDPLELPRCVVLDQPDAIYDPARAQSLYVPCALSPKMAVEVDLERRAVSEGISLETTGPDAIRRMVYGGGDLYFTDGLARIIKVSLEDRRPYGSIVLDGGVEPSAIMYMGGRLGGHAGERLYAAYGNTIETINPALAPYSERY